MRTTGCEPASRSFWKGLDVQFGGLDDFTDRLLNGRTLRLATLEFGAPRLATLFALLDHHGQLSRHVFRLSRLGLAGSRAVALVPTKRGKLGGRTGAERAGCVAPYESHTGPLALSMASHGISLVAATQICKLPRGPVERLLDLKWGLPEDCRVLAGEFLVRLCPSDNRGGKRTAQKNESE